MPFSFYDSWKCQKSLWIGSVEKSVYNNSLWRLPRVFYVGQEKCSALFPKLSGRYSTTLHRTPSTLLWDQACGLDLGEWAHPIYIRAISNRSQRHARSLARCCTGCPCCQQCSFCSSDERGGGGGGGTAEIPTDTREMCSYTWLFIPHQQSETHWSWKQLHAALLCQRSESDRPPDTRPSGPQAPALSQCRPGAEYSSKRLQRNRMEAVTGKVRFTGR